MVSNLAAPDRLLLQARGIKAGTPVFVVDHLGNGDWVAAVVYEVFNTNLEACNVTLDTGKTMTCFPEDVRTVEEHAPHLLLT